jgi:hypothetical protein
MIVVVALALAVAVGRAQIETSLTEEAVFEDFRYFAQSVYDGNGAALIAVTVVRGLCAMVHCDAIDDESTATRTYRAYVNTTRYQLLGGARIVCEHSYDDVRAADGMPLCPLRDIVLVLRLYDRGDSGVGGVSDGTGEGIVERGYSVTSIVRFDTNPADGARTLDDVRRARARAEADAAAAATPPPLNPRHRVKLELMPELNALSDAMRAERKNALITREAVAEVYELYGGDALAETCYRRFLESEEASGMRLMNGSDVACVFAYSRIDGRDYCKLRHIALRLRVLDVAERRIRREAFPIMGFMRFVTHDGDDDDVNGDHANFSDYDEFDY